MPHAWYERVEETIRDGARLGRHVAHDPRSALHGIDGVVHRWERPHDVDWARRAPIFDQGDIGSCTGNAMAGWLGTDNDHRKGRADVDEALAVQLYERATRLDGWPGSYPPDDTGSSGNAVAKAAREEGLTRGWRWAFTLGGLLRALNHGGVLVGIPWLNSMDAADPDGLLTVDPASGVRGGHEVLLRRHVRREGRVGGDNSWGPAFADRGSFWLTYAGLRRLLDARGDCTIPYS